MSYNNNTLDFDYSLFGDSHKVETVMDQVTGLITEFTYDANGNLTRKMENSGIENNYVWDEENRLRAAYYEQMMQYNLYDANGERIIKMNGEQSSLFENGSPSEGTTLIMNQFTVYPSANLTYNEELQYTKHYYIGSQRIVSRIGEETFNTFTIAGGGLKTTGVAKDELGEAQRKDLNRMARKAGAGSVKLGEAKEEAETAKTDGDSEEEEPLSAVMLPIELPIYYFHPDHLGSSSFITDSFGNPAEFFLNLPFGETFVEQRSNTTMLNNPYKFTGKELDENTGLYYYGARFYDPKLSLWLSVDPLAEKTPSESPYIYCGNNPIVFIDPDGRFKTKLGAWLHKTFNGGGSDTKQNSKTKEFYYTQVNTYADSKGSSGTGIEIKNVYRSKETWGLSIKNGVLIWGDTPDGDSEGHSGTSTDSMESSDIPKIGGSAGKIGEVSGLGKIMDFIKNFLEGINTADDVKDRVEKIVNIAKQEKTNPKEKDTIKVHVENGKLIKEEIKAKKDVE